LGMHALRSGARISAAASNTFQQASHLILRAS
jgi:hypothetical protein